MVALLILFTIIVFLTLDYFVTRDPRPRPLFEEIQARPDTCAAPQVAVPPNTVPAGVFVAPGHVWVRPEPSGSIRVGVDKILLGLLGGVEHIYALPPGSSVCRGGPLVMLRRGERALKVRSPVDGVISSANRQAAGASARFESDPFGEGWIYEITPTRLSAALKRMLTGEDALSWMRRELQRLRELLHVHSGGLVAGRSTALDGGLPAENLVEQLSDKDWNDLVEAFFLAPVVANRRPESSVEKAE